MLVDVHTVGGGGGAAAGACWSRPEVTRSFKCTEAHISFCSEARLILPVLL